jgi:hypothetical protein
MEHGWSTVSKYQPKSIVIINISRSVHLMKKWQTGILQVVMGQVVGCGVVNVMVYLFITLHTALVEHVQLFMISFVLY